MRKQEVERILKQNYQYKKSIPVINENVEKSEKQITRMPEQLQVIVRNGIYIPTEDLPSSLVSKIIRLATFNNPAFYKAQASRLSTYKIPRIIDSTDIQENLLILPRGCLDSLRSLLKEQSIELAVKDESNTGNIIDVNFYGNLQPQQEEAVQVMSSYNNGILSATTGFGKTVIAASLIADREINTLIIVHTKQLVEQWREKLTTFLKMDEKEIGQIGGGKNKITGQIDIATIQSLNYQGVVKDHVKKYGQIIVDECHRISAFSFENVLKAAEAAYVHGLTATPTRKDGLQPIMKMQCGPIRYKIDAKNQAKVRPFRHVLLPRKTSFKSKSANQETTIQNLYAEMIQDKRRNELIFNDVLKELENGSAPIILTERVEHVKKLMSMFEGFAKNIITLTGTMKKKERDAKFNQLKDIPDEKERLIIATGKYIGEGFDNAVLDTLFLAMPIAWKGTLQQYVGRLHRLHDNKDVVKVYDYVDHREKVFRTMFDKRKKGYKSMGYRIEELKSKKNESNEQMKLF